MRYHRDDVVDRALVVLDTWGLADLTMRRLGSELGVQPSALYHHFANKAALLQAVYIELEEEAATRVRAAVEGTEGGAMARVAAAFDAFFNASADPIYHRIVLRDAPVVLDRSQGRRLDHAIGLDLVIDLIEDLRREGMVGDLPIMMTARVFLAAVCEVAMSAADSDDPLAIRRDGMVVLASMIEGVRLATTAAAARAS